MSWIVKQVWQHERCDIKAYHSFMSLFVITKYVKVIDAHIQMQIRYFSGGNQVYYSKNFFITTDLIHLNFKNRESYI
jgi:hypothetical protein